MKFTADDMMSRLSSLRQIPTGSPGFDQLLGGGYRPGRLYCVFGRSATGKTHLALQAALSAARSGSRALFIDTEGTFRPERAEAMATARGWDGRELLEKIVYLRCDSASEQAEAVMMMAHRARTADCKLVVVDTLTRNFSLEFPGNSNMPARQGAIDAHLSEMARDAVINGRVYLLTNRVTFGQSGRDVGIGGQTVEQLTDTSIRLEKEGGILRAANLSTGETCALHLVESGIL